MDERRNQAAAFRPHNNGFALDTRRGDDQADGRAPQINCFASHQLGAFDNARRDQMQKLMEERRNAMMNRAPGEFLCQ